MNLTLTRTDFLSTGIFGELDADDESMTLFTLEHAYQVSESADSASASWAAKIPSGVYKCLRGQHQLNGMTHAFETFEIMDVPGHSKILFHPGNTENDSEGCVLLGLARENNMILNSRAAFEKFMECQVGVDTFTINIS